MIPFWIHPLLFLTGLAAGFVDTIAGGGGLITLPALLNLGLATPDALGTNKLQAVFGSGSATWHFHRAGMVAFKDCRIGMLFTGVGALGGSLVVQHLDAALLKQFIPWVLVAIAIYALLRPGFGMEDLRPRLQPRVFYFSAGLLLGFYDGFLGPGTGSFWAMAFILGLGFNLTKATAHTKVMNFASNVISLMVFLCSNHVAFGAGLSMGLGQYAGARLGSKVVITKGARFIRPIFITMVLLITANLIRKNFVRP